MAEDLTSTEDRNHADTTDAVPLTWDNKKSEHGDFSTHRVTETDVAFAKLQQHLSEVFSLLDDHKMQEECLQSVSDPPPHCSRVAGVLRFNRESDNPVLDLRPSLPESQHLSESSVKCEYCGQKPRPSLDLTWAEDPKTVALFCCAQHQKLWEMLVHQRHLILAGCNLEIGNPPPLDNKTTAELEELLYQGSEMGEYSPLLPIKHEQDRVYKDNSTHPSAGDTYIPGSKILSYQLSACAPGKGCWTVPPVTETASETKKGEEIFPVCDHEAFRFGISHPRGGAGFLQKYYASGMKFLTVFPDGSAQVFYPSGLLALVVVVTERKGRACIVYDDSLAPQQPIRAVFQSSGRATCYHSNGNIWMSIDRSGGQCLDETGARVRRWSWGNPCFTPPSPVRPVFLSLNRTVGVRVLGQQQVFVSFLSCGQQAKFTLGACCVKVECKSDKPASGPSINKEELFLLAGKIRVHLALKHLHQCLKTPTNLRPLMPINLLAPRLSIIIRRLLEVSDVIRMSERERTFIRRCLKDCL